MAALAGLTVLAVVDPNQPGHYPTCPSLLLTGHYCPGCGTLRCLHALTHGDWATAVHMNALALACLPYLLYAWIAWVRREAFGGPPRRLAPGWTIWTFLAVVVAFTVVRNLPMGAVLAPGRF